MSPPRSEGRTEYRPTLLRYPFFGSAGLFAMLPRARAVLLEIEAQVGAGDAAAPGSVAVIEGNADLVEVPAPAIV